MLFRKKIKTPPEIMNILKEKPENKITGKRVFQKKYSYPKVKFDGILIPEHVAVWKKYKGEIPNNMVIHHINRNKKDNNLENLKIMSKGEHMRFHRLNRATPNRNYINQNTMKGGKK